jgi:hypothetical protein
MPTWKSRTAAGLLAFGTLSGCTAIGSPSLSPSATTPSKHPGASSVTSPDTTVEATTATPAGTRSSAPATTRITAASATATAQLATFIIAAQRADGALRASAAAINTNLKGSPAKVTPATSQAFRTAEGAALTAEQAMPIGLDDQLMLPLLTVESDLTARLEALRAYPHAFGLPAGATAADRTFALRCVGNGDSAARRFAADLARLKARAAAHDPVRIQEWNSRAGLVLAVQLEHVRMLNQCDNRCGGVVVTELQPVRVTSFPDRPTDAKGFFGDTAFTAHTFEGTWFVEIAVC